MFLEQDSDKNCLNKNGDFLLWPAISRGDINRLRRLANDFKVDVDVSFGKHKLSPLHRCILHCSESVCVQVVPVLLELGADIEANTTDGKTTFFLRLIVDLRKLLKNLFQFKRILILQTKMVTYLFISFLIWILQQL